MNAGKLDKRVKIYIPAAGKTQSGAPIQTINFNRLTWASIKQVSESSGQDGDRVQQTSFFEVKLRTRRDKPALSDAWIKYNSIWLRVSTANDFDPVVTVIAAEHNPSEPPPPVIEAQA